MSFLRDRVLDGEDAGEALRLPVLCGADVELGNFILGPWVEADSCREAAAALLREIDGVPRSAPASGGAAETVPSARGPDPRDRSWRTDSISGPRRRESVGNGSRDDAGASDARDRGRKFLASNGSSAYIDLDHLELCLPEVRSAREHVACWHAMLRIAQRALREANARLGRGRRIHALVNNSDGRGNSYGSHLNFLVTRRTWDNLLERRIHYGLFLASYQASSIVFTGQGKVGSENGAPWVPYQLSQRADFFETFIGPDTMSRRALLNSRDEPLCGLGAGSGLAGGRMARLHVIFYDSNLSQVACFLKVGVFQIVLAMIAAEHVDIGLALDDPIGAVVRWSHDPDLRATARTIGNRDLSALSHQRLVFDRAARFVADGGCDGIVPDAERILELWHDTLVRLEARDLEALAPRLDWVLKRILLLRVLERRGDLAWTSPEIRHLDQVYASLCPAEGLYWPHAESGFSERIVSEDEIARFENEPPETTRAWTRAMLLRSARGAVDTVDWDLVRLRVRVDGWGTAVRTVDLAHPLRFGRAEAEPVFRASRSIEDLVLGLQALARTANRDAVVPPAASRPGVRKRESGIASETFRPDRRDSPAGTLDGNREKESNP